MNNTKRFTFIIISLALVLMTSNMAFASEKVEEANYRPYVIINGEHIVYEGEDFESPETGEYFRWNCGIDKEFTFKIRYSVESSKFVVNSDRVVVNANAFIEDDAGNHIGGHDGHLYTVSLKGWYSRDLQFSVGQSQSGTISGLKKGGNYSVKIINNDYLDYGKNLVGSGTIES